MRKEAQRRASQSGEPLPKRMRQSVLSFAPSRPSQQQIREQIVGGVCPSLVSVDASDNDRSIQYHKNLLTRNKKPLYCNGILAHKDLSDINVQDSISIFTQNYCVETAQLDHKIAFVCGDAATLLLFATTYDGSSDTVR